MRLILLFLVLLFPGTLASADSILIPGFGTVHFESVEGFDYGVVLIQESKHSAFIKMEAESMRYDPGLREIILTKTMIHLSDGSMQRSERFKIKLPESDPAER